MDIDQKTGKAPVLKGQEVLTFQGLPRLKADHLVRDSQNLADFYKPRPKAASVYDENPVLPRKHI